MTIKTTEGEEHVTSQGQGTLNTVLGAVGTAGALGLGAGLFNRTRQPQDEGDRPVTRYEMGLIRESLAKDNEIALLKAQQYSDANLKEATERQNAINMNQAVYNGVNTATVQCLQNQINQLLAMTKMVIPGGNVMPPLPSPTTTTTGTSVASGASGN